MLNWLKSKFISFELLHINPAIKTYYDYSRGTVSYSGGASVFTPVSSRDSADSCRLDKMIDNLSQLKGSGMSTMGKLLMYPFLHPETKRRLVMALSKVAGSFSENRVERIIVNMAKRGCLDDNLSGLLPAKYAETYRRTLDLKRREKHQGPQNRLFEINLFAPPLLNEVEKNVFLQIGVVNTATNARIQIGIVNHLGFHSRKAGFRLGLLNKARHDMIGVNLAILSNSCDYGKLIGYNQSLFINRAEDIKGISLAFVNKAAPIRRALVGDLEGVSIGILNSGRQVTTGLAFGLINYSHYLKGCSIGIINVGGLMEYSNGHISGCTIGIGNFSNDSADGLAIGGINIFKKNIKLPIYFSK